jgi:transposase InsO family protein
MSGAGGAAAFDRGYRPARLFGDDHGRLPRGGDLARTGRGGGSSRREAGVHDAGKPSDNGHIESFDGKLRDECLNTLQLASIAHAKEGIEASRRDYDHYRPHSSLGQLASGEYLQ